MIPWMDLDLRPEYKGCVSFRKEILAKLPGSLWSYGYRIRGPYKGPLNLDEVADSIARSLWISLDCNDLYLMFKGRGSDVRMVVGSGIAAATGLRLWKDEISAAFTNEHGDCIPCATEDEVLYCRHCGLEGVVVDPLTRASVEAEKGRLHERVRTHITPVQTPVPVLTPGEQRAWDWALKLLGAVYPGLDATRLGVVTFEGNRLLGLYQGGQISIARECLGDPSALIAVMIHEVAHGHGMEGTVEHLRAIETLGGNIISHQARQIQWLSKEIGLMQSSSQKALSKSKR